MARYESLLSRSAAPLRSDMDNNSMSREMNQQNLPPNLSTDPLDFFGAIRDLVEQSIPQQELKRYAPSQQKQQRKWKVEGPAGAAGSCSSSAGGESGLGGIVAQLEGENGTLRDRVSELERALRKAQGCPPKKVGVLVLMGAACSLVVLLLLLSLLMYGSRRTTINTTAVVYALPFAPCCLVFSCPTLPTAVRVQVHRVPYLSYVWCIFG